MLTAIASMLQPTVSMLRALRFRSRLRSLQRQQARALKPIEEAITEAEAARDRDAYGSGVAEFFFVKDGFEDDIGKLITAKLEQEAHELMVPVPDRANGDLWTDAKQTRGKYLSPAGIAHLRGAIRQEKKERREAVTFWSSILFGILGFIVALAAVLTDSN